MVPTAVTLEGEIEASATVVTDLKDALELIVTAVRREAR
jgi:hypothetical protein